MVTRGSPRHLAEQRFRTLSRNDLVGDGVGVTLVGVMCLTHAALQLNSAALLHDMRCLVSRCVEIRRDRKRDVIAAGETSSPHVLSRLARLFACMSLDAADIEAPERALDQIEMRQC